MTAKRTPQHTAKPATRRRKRQTVGESIIQGLKEAIAWTEGKNDKVRVTLVNVPQVDVRKVRLKMGLSQSRFATKFGFPPATLRNWEQGRSHPGRAYSRLAGGHRQASRGRGRRVAASQLTGCGHERAAA